jgi:uncharacterized protein
MGQEAQVVQTAYEAFGRGDIPAVLDTFSEDIEWNVPAALPHGMQVTGRDGAGSFFAGIPEHWDGFDVQIEEIVDGGNRVIGIGRASGTLKGVGEASYGFTHVFDVENGEVVRFREYVDPDESLRGA